jgi:hypothetical protein
MTADSKRPVRSSLPVGWGYLAAVLQLHATPAFAFTGCTARKLIANRFQALVAVISMVRLTISASENRAHRFAEVARRRGVRDQHHRVQCGGYTVGVERRYPPRIQQVQVLLGFAVFAGILGMPVDAMGAAVDLRGAGLDQFDQRLLKAACLHLRFRCAQRFDGIRRGLVKFIRGFPAALHRV